MNNEMIPESVYRILFAAAFLLNMTIAGRYRKRAQSGETFDRIYPATREVVAKVPAAGYWRERIAPGAPAGRPGALIGRSRAIELLVNAVLPWAAAVADGRGDRDGAERARA